MLDTHTLFSVWYWALVVALWSEIVAYTYSIPARLLRDAARGDAEAAAIVDRLARRYAARAEAFWSRHHLAAIAGASGMVAMLATLAAFAPSELALGLLLIVAPTGAMAGLGLYEALLVHRHQPEAQVLLEVLVARRRANMGAALVSITGSVAVLALLTGMRLPFSSFG